MRLLRRALFLVLATGLLLSAAPADTPAAKPRPQIPFPDFGFLPSPTVNGQCAVEPCYSGPVFHLSQSYPKTLPAEMPGFLTSADFRSDWKAYMMAVRSYVFEGNIEVDWRVQENKVRKWYHMPWQHYGPTGREGVHGLTKEAPIKPQQLAQSQTASNGQTYAVGFYNPRGGYAIGKVWANHFKPDTHYLQEHGFPEGTVVGKLLLMTLPNTDVPSLAVNPIQWDAYVATSFSSSDRVMQKVTLIQMDIAVKDKRAPLGWIFGTFQYNGTLNNKNPWDNLIPVGMMVGNDPTITDDTYTNPSPSVTKINPAIKESFINDGPELPPTHLGWDGRLNGPVDNPRSSCISCHMTAESPVKSQASPLFEKNPPAVGSTAWMRWFQNLHCGKPFDATAYSQDFSLQMAIALQNFRSWDRTQGGIFAASYNKKAPQAKAAIKALTESHRLPIQGAREPGAGDEVEIIRDLPNAEPQAPPKP
jgi:hypothetical protein